MENQQAVETVYQAIETFGLMPTLEKVFGAGAKIRLPFAESLLSTKIEELDLTVRSFHCLKRAGVDTVEKIIDAMHQDALWNIRGLGKGSRAEIHVKIYELGYYNLSTRERKEFARSLIELNMKKVENA